MTWNRKCSSYLSTTVFTGYLIIHDYSGRLDTDSLYSHLKNDCQTSYLFFLLMGNLSLGVSTS